jgi:hypothetical protein
VLRHVVAGVGLRMRSLTRRVASRLFRSRSRRRVQAWSIGIYTGPSPFELRADVGIRNPVLTSADVSDVPARIRSRFLHVARRGSLAHAL